jgi:hypothetical protein
MNDNEIVQALWSSDELSEFDDSDADPDFALVNIAQFIIFFVYRFKCTNVNRFIINM